MLHRLPCLTGPGGRLLQLRDDVLAEHLDRRHDRVVWHRLRGHQELQLVDAGFLAGWLRGLPLDHCLTIASRCGRAVASKSGGLQGQLTWEAAAQLP